MRLWRGFAATASATCVLSCAPHRVEAVVFTGTDAATENTEDAGVDDASTGDATPPFPDAGEPRDAGPLVWPNDAGHTANSDPWIAEHHDGITLMQPEVLLLDFANTFYEPPRDGGAPILIEAGYPLAATVNPLVQAHVDAFELASQYQGYKTPDAPAFLQYRVKKVVDLRDDNGNVNSSKLPISNGAVNYGQLNSDAFAALIDIKDASGTPLNLCQLFTSGLINEVWGMAADPLSANDPPTTKFGAFVETKEAYDDTNAPTGRQVCTSTTNAPCIVETLACGVSMRFFDFNPGRGAGCHLFASGLQWPQYVTTGVLPALENVAQTFFNFDFVKRFGAPFGSFFDVCPANADGGTCIDWMTEVNATSGPGSNASFNFSPMSAGCGNVVFPPNATAFSAQEGDPPVLSSCENYGLHNGNGGADKTTLYTNARIDALYPANAVTDCGGPQPAYLLQSMPGLGTTATAADGTPMKNWWVYLFY